MIKSMSILVSFESIIDTDMGLMRLIKSDYNTGFFYPGVVNNTEDFQHLALNLRRHVNPLATVMDTDDDEQIDTMNDLYKQFLDQEYNKILDLSPTGTFNKIIASNMYSKDLFKITVLCSDQAQADILKIKEVKFDNVIITKDRKEVSLKSYQVLAVKDIFELDDFVNLERKAIYVPDYRFNVMRVKGFDSPLLPRHIVETYGEKNEIFVYAAYVFKDSYQGLDDEEDFLDERIKSQFVKQN